MGKKSQANQRGAVLLLFMVVLIAIASIFVSSLMGKKAAEVTQNKIDHDYKVLRKAKQALLSFTVAKFYPLVPPTGRRNRPAGASDRPQHI